MDAAIKRSNHDYKHRAEKYAVVTGGTVINARPHVRRNEICRFCASGLKFKHCCLKKTGLDGGVAFKVVHHAAR